MRILQSRSFERKVKKFSKQEKSVLDKQVTNIAENPPIGTEAEEYERMNPKVIIRNETLEDAIAITDVTVAAFKSITAGSGDYSHLDFTGYGGCYGTRNTKT